MEYFGPATFTTVPQIPAPLSESFLPGYSRFLLEPPALPFCYPSQLTIDSIRTNEIVEPLEPLVNYLKDAIMVPNAEALLPTRDALVVVGEALVATAVVYCSWRVSKGWNSDLYVNYNDITGGPVDAHKSDVDKVQTISAEPLVADTEVVEQTSAKQCADQPHEGDVETDIHGVPYSADKPTTDDVTDLELPASLGAGIMGDILHRNLLSVFSRLTETRQRLTEAEGERDLLKAELTSQKQQVTSLQREWTAENERRLLTEMKMMVMLRGEVTERSMKEPPERRCSEKDVQGESLESCSKTRGTATEPHDLNVVSRDDIPKKMTQFNWLPPRFHTPLSTLFPSKLPTPAFGNWRNNIDPRSSPEIITLKTSADQQSTRNKPSTRDAAVGMSVPHHTFSWLPARLTEAFGAWPQIQPQTDIPPSGVTLHRSPPKQVRSNSGGDERTRHDRRGNSSTNPEIWATPGLTRTRSALRQLGPHAIVDTFRSLMQGYHESGMGGDAERCDQREFLQDGLNADMASPVDQVFYSAPTSPNCNANHAEVDCNQYGCIEFNQHTPEQLTSRRDGHLSSVGIPFFTPVISTLSPANLNEADTKMADWPHVSVGVFQEPRDFSVTGVDRGMTSFPAMRVTPPVRKLRSEELIHREAGGASVVVASVNCPIRAFSEPYLTGGSSCDFQVINRQSSLHDEAGITWYDTEIYGESLDSTLTGN